ncbi:hypothetical protein [Xenorhabdus szentirmaii]|uniref:Uncharacterized protein n=3 Tax=Xenorhabdus szentirmaii TaxID=290112 RepID=W1IYD9_9GAMM|nr:MULTISPECIES: hypothetical protein [unclassified Xenorhabdus]MBD2779025.1 hypothetical protein [Xenorhabdus sp. 38]MBD2799961.1 hypothetical protein [Xenorhabdus sp. M]PHM34109.1 hypothetical protein Xsze_00503 [Xenorhabdus szentirmaii DSM 16338]PHM42832.1 hypothetical protein Xszus_02579 [Xenorhabdus szentirmaii]MBD2803339.1 hypothetical protein [Xenorhabdus sp. ZM]
MILKNINTQKEFEIEGNFSSSRLLIGEFHDAHRQLVKLLRRHHFRKGLRWFLDWRNRIIIHPLEKSEGGLCSVEQRILTEVVHISFRGYINEAVIYEGEHLLSDEEVKAQLNKRFPIKWS